MGLDLIVEGRAKPGHESEWRRILDNSFAEEEPSEAQAARFNEISIPPYQSISAPRVGFDNAADAWIIKVRKAEVPEDVAAVLKEFHGYHVVRLVTCDGVTKYSNGGLYEGADETSFRGSLLEDCRDVLSKNLLSDAWNSKFPEVAISYGQALLAAAETAEAAGLSAQPRRTIFSRLRLVKEADPLPIETQLDIVRAAGRWFVFWGQRGHAIRAWF